MKRLVVILSSLAVLYAGAVWAVEGCRNDSIVSELHHHADVVSTHSEDPDPAPFHRTHSHSGKIHCLNFFGEFILSARVSVNPGRDAARYANCDAAQIPGAADSTTRIQRINGPPTASIGTRFPRHLFLSVLRI